MALINNEQQKFLNEQVPAFVERVQVLGMDMNEVAALLLKSGGDN